MPTRTVFNLPTMHTQNDGHVVSDVERAGHGTPMGRLCHTASLQEGGSLMAVDAWESAEMLAEFDEALIPVFHNAGLIPVDPRVHAIQTSSMGSSAVLDELESRHEQSTQRVMRPGALHEH